MCMHPCRQEAKPEAVGPTSRAPRLGQGRPRPPGVWIPAQPASPPSRADRSACPRSSSGCHPALCLLGLGWEGAPPPVAPHPFTDDFLAQPSKYRPQNGPQGIFGQPPPPQPRFKGSIGTMVWIRKATRHPDTLPRPASCSFCSRPSHQPLTTEQQAPSSPPRGKHSRAERRECTCRYVDTTVL